MTRPLPELRTPGLTGSESHVDGSHQIQALLSGAGSRLLRRSKPGGAFLTLFRRREICVKRHSLAAVRVKVRNVVVVAAVVVDAVVGPLVTAPLAAAPCFALAPELKLSLLRSGCSLQTEPGSKLRSHGSELPAGGRLTFPPERNVVRISAVICFRRRYKTCFFFLRH